MMYQFSEAITNNILRTYTFAHAKNAHQFKEDYEKYNPLTFFEWLLDIDPFNAFMELDGFQFQRTKNTLDRYEIPYTPEQEKRARVYHDVTDKMKKERSDYVSFYVDDVKNTGIVKLSDSFLLTTEKSLSVARQLKQLPKNQKTENIIYEHKIPSSLLDAKEQYEALKTCLENQVSCLIGGAGTGKSFVTSNIIEQLLLNDKKVAILAPTHKAKESLQQKLTRGTVKTIHSFVHNPFECDAIVIDESGMLSTPLMHSLLRVYDDHQLIFIGDKNQLPPVEYGRPFELIQDHFTTYEIKKNRRSEAVDIISMGREILGIPQNANMGHPNIEIVATPDDAFKRGAEVALTFTNNNVSEINEQQRMKQGVASISPKFKIGEEIIATTNEPGRFYNGQLFKVVGYDRIQNKKTGHVLEIIGRYELEYNFTYAYGLTVHKAQGSEWDVVAYQPSAIDSQNIAYVAVTRAKKKLIIIGDGLKSVYPPERKWKQLHETYRI